MKWIIATLVLFGVAALGVAYYRSWVTVETQPGKDTTSINIKVDRAKAREDIQEVREQAKDAVQNAQDRLTSPATLEGELMVVSPVFDQVMLKSPDKTHTIIVAKDASIQRDDRPVALEELQMGDKATVKVREEGGLLVAHSISAHSK